MLFVGTQGVESAHAENSHQPAEDVRLLEIDFDQLARLALDVINGPADVSDLEFRRQRHFSVKAFGVSGQASLL